MMSTQAYACMQQNLPLCALHEFRFGNKQSLKQNSFECFGNTLKTGSKRTQRDRETSLPICFLSIWWWQQVHSLMSTMCVLGGSSYVRSSISCVGTYVCVSRIHPAISPRKEKEKCNYDMNCFINYSWSNISKHNIFIGYRMYKNILLYV